MPTAILSKDCAMKVGAQHLELLVFDKQNAEINVKVDVLQPQHTR